MSEAKIARQQLQQAIDAIGEGFILYDSNDRIVLCNHKYRDFFPLLGDLLKPGTHFMDIIQAAAEAGVIVEAVTDPDAWITSRIEYHRRKTGSAHVCTPVNNATRVCRLLLANKKLITQNKRN